ncbi:MAG TPA: DUF4388 domain-containing protein, partial [Chloroflexota bacterium]
MIQIDGFLGAIGLADVVQLLDDLHETGQLRLIGSGSTGQLAFDQGVLVDAVYGEQRGLEALTSCMLIQDDAEFRFTRGESPRERTLRLSSGELK